MHPSKRKGSEAEREAARLISSLLGVDVKRRHNIGTHEDIGDLIGVPNTAIQVTSRGTDVVSVAVVRKPVEADEQARRAGDTFSATFVRIRGGTWRVVMTPEMWATYWREATEPQVKPTIPEGHVQGGIYELDNP
jgi:hypothetical protein